MLSAFGDFGHASRWPATWTVPVRGVTDVIEIVSPPCLIAGTGNEPLAQEIARELGEPLSDRRIEVFPDGETYVRLGASVRGRDVYIIQPTSAPVNEHLVELALLLDTVRRAAAGRVTAVIPYYGYARQDRKFIGREPISAKLVANLITAAGADRVVAVDLHSPAIQGFFDIGMDHLTAIPLLTEHLKPQLPPDSIVVSPDTGGVKRADLYARLLNLPLAILHKKRSNAHEVQMQAVIGDIKGKHAIIVDDIIATGGTICEAIETLVRGGAQPEVIIVATHPVFSGAAPQLLRHAAIREILVTDTIAVAPEVSAQLPTLRTVSVAALLANAIRRLHEGLSLSELFASDAAPPI
ncbi:MAG: ribose-phosphate diphosphokinase [Ktedonobacterales bacterium]